LIAHNVAVELCPVGNVLTGAAASLDRHPVKDYLRRGVQVAIGSDDPALFNTTLTHEYEVLVTELGFTADELEQMALNSVDLSWLAEADKASLRATFAGELRQLRAELGV
jgi:adenosine deaminase